jgi:hypothetical protein
MGLIYTILLSLKKRILTQDMQFCIHISRIDDYKKGLEPLPI